MTNNFAKQPQHYHKQIFVKPQSIKNNDIFWANMKMHDGNYKERPVLVVAAHDTKDPKSCFVMPITSKLYSKSADIAHRYAAIEDWKDCGLKKPSYVDCHPGKAVWIDRDKLNDRGHFKPMAPESQRKVNHHINEMIKEVQAQEDKKAAHDIGLHY